MCRQQSEEGEKNGSEEEDEEKPGKRVMGPRKKFVWNDKLRYAGLWRTARSDCLVFPVT